jgi:hypothetical protein
LAAFLRRSVLYRPLWRRLFYEAREQCCFLVPGQSHFAGSGLGFMAEEFIIERAMKKVENSVGTTRTSPSLSLCQVGTQIPARYIHVLLFVCPDCNLPVSISRVSNEKNLETVDAERLHITCSYCDSSADVTAVTAKRHYVEDWT